MQQQIAGSLDERTRRALTAAGLGAAGGVDADTGPRDSPGSHAEAVPTQRGRTANRQRPPSAGPTPPATRAAASDISISAARRMALAAARQRAAGAEREDRARLQQPAQGPRAAAPTSRADPRARAKVTPSLSGAAASAPGATAKPPRRERGPDRRDAARPDRKQAFAAPGPVPRRPVVTVSATEDRTSQNRATARHLPEHIRHLPESLRHDPKTFRGIVQRMDPDERHALSAAIRRELLFVTRGRYATEARRAAEKQARFLLATLAGRPVPPPAAPKKPATKNARPSSAKKPTTEEKSASRFRSVRTYAPSPSKFLLPARGLRVSGGHPTLGRRR